MPALSEDRIATLLAPYLSEISPNLCSQLSSYLDLLLKWNTRTNLTAIREPEQIVCRHFGESLFAARHVANPKLFHVEQFEVQEAGTLLDFGSGAGFPGLPIALLHPEIAVTLAESQNKKAAFLREAIRTLNLTNVEVWPDRVEAMPPARQFHTVTLRAVDNMAAAIAAAAHRATHELLVLATAPPELPPNFTHDPPILIPGTQTNSVFRATRTPIVPRGTIGVLTQL